MLFPPFLLLANVRASPRLNHSPNSTEQRHSVRFLFLPAHVIRRGWAIRLKQAEKPGRACQEEERLVSKISLPACLPVCLSVCQPGSQLTSHPSPRNAEKGYAYHSLPGADRKNTPPPPTPGKKILPAECGVRSKKHGRAGQPASKKARAGEVTGRNSR